jgi:hypothetical protein
MARGRNITLYLLTLSCRTRHALLIGKTKCAELAQNLYKTLIYPSMKELKLVILSNQMKDCPVTIQDIDVAMKIWSKKLQH